MNSLYSAYPSERTISLWAKPRAVRISKGLFKKTGLRAGQRVRFKSKVSSTGVVVCPAVERPSLEALLALVTPNNLPEEADTSWGRPVGSEIW